MLKIQLNLNILNTFISKIENISKRGFHNNGFEILYNYLNVNIP